MFAKLFGNKEPPKPKTMDQMSQEEIKEFQASIKKDIRDAVREIDKQMFTSERMVAESKRDLEKKIKEGADRNSLKIYAQNVMKAQKAKEKQMVQKANIQSIEFSVNQMIANVKMSKTMGNAAQLMGKINSLANIPEISKNIQHMQMQMEKMGIVGEMVDDAMDMVDNDVDLDEKAQELLDQMVDKHDPIKKKIKEPAKTDDLDEQIRNLAL